VRCPAGTTCRTVVRTRVRRSGTARRVPPLAFSVPGARVSKVRLELGHLARRGARLSVRVVATARGGTRVARSFRVKLARRTQARAGGDPARAGGAPSAPAAVSRPLVGISDQEPGTFADPLFTALPIATARLIVPWDVQWTDPGRLEAWLAAARRAGVEPLIALGAARGSRCPASPCRLPAVADYEDAVRALVRSHPSVRQLTPWNEPNHASQPTAGTPARAAAYYDAARAACPACTLVAGDVLDAPGFLRWLAVYRRALGEAPAVWGLHDYYDTTYGRSDGIDGLLAAVPGEVWLTETGGIVAHRRDDGRVSLPADEQRAAAGVRRAIALADARPARVRRVYLYQWRAGDDAAFDGGLLSPSGEPRAGYAALRRALAERVPTAPPRVAARAGSAQIAVTGRVTLAGRRLRLPVLCVATGGRCTGRMSVESAIWRTAALINGHASGRLVAPRERGLALRGGVAKIVRLRLGRRPPQRGQLRLRVTLSEPGARTALVLPVLRVR
jgi:hypothetical protein